VTDPFAGWEDAYRGSPPPWDIGRPQPVVVAIASAGGFRSPVLDAGCGTGENALYLAGLGLEVVGLDGARLAIDRAREKAAASSLDVEFVAGDALSLSELGRSFASVLDCGLFHTFDDPERERYVAELHDVVAPGGAVHLLCFCDREPWGGGPRRVSQAEIRAAFADGWTVQAIEEVRFATRLHDAGARAWHATIQRSEAQSGNASGPRSASSDASRAWSSAGSQE
jgi:SAM-dependent methyltransferase